MQQASKYKILKLYPYQKLEIWDAKRLFLNDNLFNNNYPLVLFKHFASKPNIEKVKIEDSETYKILGVRSYGKGAFISREVKGSTLTMRVYQKVKANYLFWCKVDTKNGAFGIITPELADGVASSNMTFAELDTNKINPDYLQLIFSHPTFYGHLDKQVTGTTNRQYIKFDELLNNIEIPLPSIERQIEIVDLFKQKHNSANDLENKADFHINEIESLIYKELGLKRLELKSLQKGTLNLFKYSDVIDRWDIYNSSLTVFSSLSKGKYAPIEIGKVYDFVNRSWNSRNHNDDFFHYVEIGAVDPQLGITESSKIEINKAPSRATQTVKTGDLIIGTTRPYLKKFAIVNEAFNGFVCSSGFQVIAPSDKYNLLFLLEYLKSDLAIKQFEFFMTGALYPAITGKDLKRVLIPLPPLEIQDRIANDIINLKMLINQLRTDAEIKRTNAIQELESELFN